MSQIDRKKIRTTNPPYSVEDDTLKVRIYIYKKKSILFSELDPGQRIACTICPEVELFNVTLPGLAGNKGLNSNTDHKQDE